MTFPGIERDARRLHKRVIEAMIIDGMDSYVYFVGCADVELVKIGRAKDVQKRLVTLQIGCPLELRLLAAFGGGISSERILHQRFAEDRARGEWFRRSRLLDELIRFVQDLRVAA
jgi:hypothetical protein